MLESNEDFDEIVLVLDMLHIFWVIFGLNEVDIFVRGVFNFFITRLLGKSEQ